MKTQEQARQYAEEKMFPAWDRNNKFLIIEFYNHMLEFLAPETPTNTATPPLAEEGGIEEKMKELYPDIDEKEFRAVYNGLGADQKLADAIYARKGEQAAYIAGANSVRQQGDAQEIKQSQLFRHVLEQCRAEELRTWRVMNEANKASGMGPIKKSSLLQLVENVLDNSQSFSMPQPGFVEQLRAANPWKDNFGECTGGYAINCKAWDQCCDRAAELLKGKGEEGK